MDLDGERGDNSAAETDKVAFFVGALRDWELVFHWLGREEGFLSVVVEERSHGWNSTATTASMKEEDGDRNLVK